MRATDTLKQALSGTKRIHAEMRECEASGTPPALPLVAGWRAEVRRANLELVKLSRQLSATEERAKVEQALMSEEMRGELISREANAARTAERFRVLNERQGGGVSAHENAINAAATIESQIADICSAPLSLGVGTTALMERKRIKGS